MRSDSSAFLVLFLILVSSAVEVSHLYILSLLGGVTLWIVDESSVYIFLDLLLVVMRREAFPAIVFNRGA